MGDQEKLAELHLCPSSRRLGDRYSFLIGHDASTSICMLTIHSRDIALIAINMVDRQHVAEWGYDGLAKS